MNRQYDQTPTKRQLINDLTNRYFDLVSIARKSNEDFEKYPPLREFFDRMMQECPHEIELLKGKGGDWQHGFNSGMLACLRLLGTGKMTMNKIEEFPDLDT